MNIIATRRAGDLQPRDSIIVTDLPGAVQITHVEAVGEDVLITIGGIDETFLVHADTQVAVPQYPRRER